MIEATKENPAPLDGYESAKPNEPIFTLQGGDPLAAPLVRLWAYLARVRAGLRGDVSWIDTPLYAAKQSSIEHDEEQKLDLLKRATEAEKISWHMDGYRRGEINLVEEMKTTDLNRLDIYDVRRRCASTISNFFSELNDYREELISRGWMDKGSITDVSIIALIENELRPLHDQIEIKRGNV